MWPTLSTCFDNPPPYAILILEENMEKLPNCLKCQDKREIASYPIDFWQIFSGRPKYTWLGFLYAKPQLCPYCADPEGKNALNEELKRRAKIKAEKIMASKKWGTFKYGLLGRAIDFAGK
jgi:hypothetical protein